MNTFKNSKSGGALMVGCHLSNSDTIHQSHRTLNREITWLFCLITKKNDSLKLFFTLSCFDDLNI